ncbi:unnamed protein product [Caenorhabditis sp. 36 PRJEB53466]|nr:unnamed protein product [Caenorhabditis sp. 36 PRJEB53466]
MIPLPTVPTTSPTSANTQMTPAIPTIASSSPLTNSSTLASAWRLGLSSSAPKFLLPTTQGLLMKMMNKL